MARLTKEQLADKSRYQFKTKEVEVEELGGSVQVRSLSVAKRAELPTLLEPQLDEAGQVVTGADGDPILKRVGSIDDLAVTIATVVSDPELSVEEAKGIVGDWPAEAFDAVLRTFGEMFGDRDPEEAAEVAKEFPGSED